MAAGEGLSGDAVVGAALARGAGISLRGRSKTAGSAGEAMMSPKSTIGDDDRRRADAAKYPFRVVLRVESDFGHREQGTAFLVAPRLLLTAGHCVFHPGSGRLADRIGLFDDAGRAYSVAGWDCHRDWKQSQSPAADIGFIRVVPPIGDVLGYMGTAAIGASQLKGDFAVSGYPLRLANGRQQYFDLGKITRQYQGQFGYAMDTGDGQSGSPVFFIANGIATAAGVHTQGTGEHGNFNLGLRMTPALVEVVKGWIAAS